MLEPVQALVFSLASFVTFIILNKDKDWLFKKLNLKSKKELKNIMLCIYNQEKDDFKLYLKK